MTIKKINIGIDASRIRSGGAVAHIIGIIESFEESNDINIIHLWAYSSLLDKIPDRVWLQKHSHPYLEKSLFAQIWWQLFLLKKYLKKFKCDILFSPDASTFCLFRPLVVLSQDLLSYEPGVLKNYNFGFHRFRINILRYIQNFAFKRSKGVLFLSQYASNLIQNNVGHLNNSVIVPHGINADFFLTSAKNFSADFDSNCPVRCIYVSNIDVYKYHWNVVEGLNILRQRGLNIQLRLIGGGQGYARDLLDFTISKFSAHSWVTIVEFMANEMLPTELDQSDIFIFASGCENLPITLLEGMARGLPIASSNRGPMPEVLRDAGLYFDPESPVAIADAVYALIESSELRFLFSSKSLAYSENYSWNTCSNRTFSFITSCCKNS
jgi:glycosyltransferase involved in cell wall biosynthesis